jgi:hypothetical protein
LGIEDTVADATAILIAILAHKFFAGDCLFSSTKTKIEN